MLRRWGDGRGGGGSGGVYVQRGERAPTTVDEDHNFWRCGPGTVPLNDESGAVGMILLKSSKPYQNGRLLKKDLV